MSPQFRSLLRIIAGVAIGFGLYGALKAIMQHLDAAAAGMAIGILFGVVASIPPILLYMATLKRQPIIVRLIVTIKEGDQVAITSWRIVEDDQNVSGHQAPPDNGQYPYN